MIHSYPEYPRFFKIFQYVQIFQLNRKNQYFSHNGQFIRRTPKSLTKVTRTRTTITTTTIFMFLKYESKVKIYLQTQYTRHMPKFLTKVTSTTTTTTIFMFLGPQQARSQKVNFTTKFAQKCILNSHFRPVDAKMWLWY